MSEAAVAADHGHHDTNYIAKFWWLVGLTAVEVAIAIFLRDVAIVKLLGLSLFAFWKAGIVMQSFMHLRDEPKALKLGLLFPAFLIAVLILLVSTDGVWLDYASFDF